MAIDTLDIGSGAAHDGGSLLGAIASLAPIGIGGAVGYSRIQSNSPITASSLDPRRGGRLGRIARGVGSGLKTHSATLDKRQAEDLQKITEKLMASDAIKEMVATSEKQNAVVQSLLSTLDDPASGLSQVHTFGYKEQLMQILDGKIDDNKAKELVEKLVKTVAEGGEEGRQRFGSYLREFRGVQGHLVAPKMDFKASQVFNPISTDKLTLQGRERYQKIVEKMGPGAERFLRVGEVQQGFGQVSHSVQFLNRSGQAIQAMPLEIDIRGDAAPLDAVRRVRLGAHHQTAYKTNRFAATGQGILETSAKYGPGNFGIKELKAAGALVNLEDYWISQMDQYLSAPGEGGVRTLRHKKEFGAFIRENLETDNRFSGLSADAARRMEGHYPGLRDHLQRAARHQTGALTLLDMQALSQDDQARALTSTIGSSKVPVKERLEAGISAARILGVPTDGRQYGTVAMAANHAINQIQTGGKTTRETMPVTARLEQVVGREAMFVGRKDVMWSMGKHGAFEAGAAQKAIGWAGALTGAANKAVLLGVGDGPLSQLSGLGQAYTTSTERMLTTRTVPILDPKTRGHSSSALLEKVLALAEGDMLTVSRKQMKELGGYLGEGPDGLRFAPNDPAIKEYKIGRQMSSEAGGKAQHNLIIGMERELGTGMKVFSPLHKGTVVQTTRNQALRVVGGYGVEDAFFERNQIPLQQTYIGYGDMFKKAPDVFNIQMMGGLGLLSGDSNVFENIEKRVLGGKAKYDLGGEKVAKVTSAIIEQLSAGVRSGQINARDAGMVLAGVYSKGTHYEEKGKTKYTGLKGQSAKFSINRETLVKTMRTAFGEHADKVLEGARGGLALGATAFAAGTGVGDFGLGRAGVEPRFFQMLQTRLMDFGLDDDTISEFLLGIYKNKIGFADAMRGAEGMTPMMESLLGGRVPSARVQGAKTITVENLQEIMSKNPEGLAGYLNSTEKGAYLDLGSTRNTKAGSALATAVKKVTGGTELYLPGKEVLSGMRGTVIKQADKTLKIGAKFERSVNQFANDLISVATNNRATVEEAERGIARFKKDTSKLYATSLAKLGSGKIKGAQMQIGVGYGSDGVFLTDAQKKMVKSLGRRTRGQAAFMDSTAFTSMLNDFGSGAKDKAQRLERFFLGLEGDVAKAEGIFQVTARHPMLSRGNVTVSQVFRHVGEVGLGGTQDKTWRAMMDSGVGQKAIKALKRTAGYKGEITSFGDVSKVSSKAGRKAFFKEMARGLGQFTGDGGGVLYLPDQKLDVHLKSLGSMPLKVDFGIAGAAIGDFDGDWYSSFMVDSKMGEKIKTTLQDSTKMEDYLVKDARYKISGEIYAEAMKETLATKASGIEMSVEKRAQQDLLKEMASKRATGPLDVALTQVRQAVLESADADPRMANEALSFLKMLQEHSTIKGKKLPTYRPFAEWLSGGVADMMEGRGAGLFKSVIENELISESTQLGAALRSQEGVVLDRVAGGASHLAKGVTGQVAQLDNLIDYMGRVTETFRASGGRSRASTQNMLAAAFNQKNLGLATAAMRDLLFLGEGVSGGLMEGWAGKSAKTVMAVAEGAMDKVMAAAGKLDSKMMGPLALGVGGSLMLGSMFGREGYAPEPLVMNGERPPQRVMQGISAGNLFSQKQVGPSPQDLGNMGDPYGMVNRPLNTGTMYADKPNAYQIRGQINSTRGIGEMASYLNTLTGGSASGSIRINDSRRPISPAYADRLLGEY